MAEAAPHGLVEGARTAGDVVVHDQAHQAVGLQRDRAVAVCLDELPEHVVAQLEQGLLAVGRLAEREHARPAGQQAQDGTGVDGLGDVGDSSSHTSQRYR